MQTRITDEAMCSASAYTAAGGCADYLLDLGLSPQVAGLVSVILGVVVRVALDWWSERRARARAAAPAPADPPPSP